MQNNCLFILNPKSGGGKGLKQWPKIEEAMKVFQIEYQYLKTKSKFHAPELVAEGIKNGFRKIISIGGDGTLHECVNGIMNQSAVDPKECTLGIFPVGTGNDWIKTNVVPTQFESWLNYFRNEKTIQHDIGKITYQKGERKETRYFVNIAGLGFEAEAVERACRKGNEVLGGKLYYLLVVAKTLFSYKSQSMNIVVDGKEFNGKKFCVTVGLNRFNGGGMQLLPNANPTDGLFDVAIIDDISTTEVIRNLSKLYNGKIVNHPKVSSITGKTVKVTSQERVLLEADGEFLGSSETTFEILPNHLNMMID